MRAITLTVGISIAMLLPAIGISEDSEARDRLVEKIQAVAVDFCRKEHNTSGSLHPNAITPAVGAGGELPDLMVDYRGIRCAGVADAPLKQGGFCGLTTGGMKCKVARFSYQDGEYVEVSFALE